MKLKTIFSGLVAVFLLAVLAVVFVGAASGFLKVPVLTSLLGADKQRDLGVAADPAQFKTLLDAQSVKLSGPSGKYCLDCYVAYSDTGPMDITLSSMELSSYLQATNDPDGTLKGIQVKLGQNDEAEVSAYVSLKRYGYDVEGPVYAKGSISKASDNSIALVLRDSQAGLVPVPSQISSEGQKVLEDRINTQLSRMPGLKIDVLEIKDAGLHYTGQFPKSASA